jgi:hypothetical protein
MKFAGQTPEGEPAGAQCTVQCAEDFLDLAALWTHLSPALREAILFVARHGAAQRL